MEIYHGNLASKEDLISGFQIKPDDLNDCQIVYASYGGGGYDGYAFVVFKKDGKFFEVHGSHCSCYGLEDQWEPEELDIEVFKARFKRKRDWVDDYNEIDYSEALRNMEAMV